MEERDYEALASEQGWNKDFEPNKVSAQVFVERGEQIAGILKSKNAKLEDRINRLEQTNKKFGEHFTQTIEAQRKKSAETIRDLEAKVAQAITDGDGQEYTRASREIESIKSETPVQTDDAGSWSELSQGWVRENPWYNESRKLGRFADGIAEELVAQGYRGEAYFSELTKQVKAEFPEDFKNPNRESANSVEAGGQRVTKDSKEHTYANLPADAKAACKDFIKSGIFANKEDYVNTYEWED